ncbi:hypothetical protein ROHU_008596 [Labeo rohita]|uniref:Uncharacterized protein n=1 Tax=Labeo rohita TaxID=84645 RepID=A0A498MEI1_LABRO|nr:hypothetical protein ROHU_008596 [Labeo rohita]
MCQLIRDPDSGLHRRLWAESDCSCFAPLSPQTHCGSHCTHTHTHTVHSLVFLGGREWDGSLVLSLPNYSSFKSLLAWKAFFGEREPNVPGKFGGRFLKALGSIRLASMRNTAFPQRVCALAGDPNGTSVLEGREASSFACVALDRRDGLG